VASEILFKINFYMTKMLPVSPKSEAFSLPANSYFVKSEMGKELTC